MLRARGGALVALAALAMIGCSSDGGEGEGGAATLPTAPPTVAPASSDSSSSTSSVAPSSSSSSSSTSSVVPVSVAPGTVGLSPDGPWRLVDSAPGVTTPGLVYELMPKLWAVIQVEETEQSTYSWTLNEADRPIIEAYLQAELTYFTAVTSNPIDLDIPGWTEFYAEEPTEFESLRARKTEGQVADLDLGVVLRPSVLGDERTEAFAIVSDCILDGAVFILPDGSLAAGSNRGVVNLEWGARLELVNGFWRVVASGPVVGGCVQ